MSNYTNERAIALDGKFILNQFLNANYGVKNREKQAKIPVADVKRDLPVYLFFAIFSAVSVFSLWALQLDWARVAERLPKLGSVFVQLTQFSFERFPDTMMALVETISVSLLALIYGMILGLVLGAFAASNITPWQPLSIALKSIFAFLRAVPTPVWVLLVLASMGFGMAAGIVGLTFHVTAFFGRAFSQIFEEVPEETIEALKATGAGRIQVFFSAVLPSSVSGMIAWTALRLETNYSEASILGMVGAGGVGYVILASMSSYKLGRAGLAITIVFIFALAMELLTTYIKRKVK